MMKIAGNSFKAFVPPNLVTKNINNQDNSINNFSQKSLEHVSFGNNFCSGRDFYVGSVAKKRRIPLEKINIENQDAAYAYAKIQKYVRILPNFSKLKKPIVVKLGNISNGVNISEKNLAFVVDKTEPNRIKVLAQTYIDNLNDWNLDKGYKGTSLSCIFNKEGQMVQGDMMFTDTVPSSKKSRGRGLHFCRSINNKRTIDIGGVTYHPERGSKDVWIKESSTVANELYSVDSRDVSDYFNYYSSPLMEIFKSLTRKDTSIFV